MKILNLYASVGGNRMLWGDKHEITAVEFNQSIADAYKDLYPNDTVIVGDAHQYLLDFNHEFDFIWASPPCQSHSKARACGVWSNQVNAVYPDMRLYQEIILLQKFGKCNWVIENVVPYYKPLISPSFTIGRHHFWSNKFLINSDFIESSAHHSNISELEQRKGVDLSKYKFTNISKKQVLRNMVEPELGKYIFEQITGEKL